MLSRQQGVGVYVYVDYFISLSHLWSGICICIRVVIDWVYRRSMLVLVVQVLKQSHCSVGGYVRSVST